jgi:hypothetical protein
LLVALLFAALLAAIASSLIVVSTTETVIAGGYRTAQELLYAAEAALERAFCELSLIPDWRFLLAPPPANVVASFSDTQAAPRAPDGRVLDLARLTLVRQTQSDAAYGPAFGADTPQWRLFAHARLQDLVGSDLSTPPAYTLIWVSDDGADGDGDPGRDSNERVWVRGEAYGAAGSRRSIEATVGRADNGAVRLLTWKEAR